MKVLTITIPERFKEYFGNPFSEILKLLPDLNQSWDEIIVDFSKSKFVVPHFLGPLSCVLHKKSQEGVEITVINAVPYLSTIHFFNGTNAVLFENKVDLSYYNNKTYLPIIHFPTGLLTVDADKRIEILSAVNTLLKAQLKLPNNVLEAFYYFLDELTQNIVDHSKQNFGTVFAQFYPEKGYLDLSICDVGKGIFESYKMSDKFFPSTNEEAINYAVFGKSTKDIPESRGYGISTSKKMLVKGLKGKFLLMSGSEFFVQVAVDKEDGEIISVDSELFFQGCMVNLRIPVFVSDSINIYNYIE
ncbi:MAG: hypothetical protein PHQ74_02220 [Crocinitomicaceae bacterium]|nr:hypothetical protein [Crocinitomicaceae bacterium]